jgi:hypothetical protein
MKKRSRVKLIYSVDAIVPTLLDILIALFEHPHHPVVVTTTSPEKCGLSWNTAKGEA